MLEERREIRYNIPAGKPGEESDPKEVGVRMNAARILCIIVLLLEVRGLSLSIANRKWKILIFYTQLSNLAAAVSSLLLVLLGEPAWVTALRYLSTCMLIMTFLVTACVLVPMGGDPKTLLWSGSGLYHHVLCPIISSASYIFAERHSGMIWLPVLVTLVYGLVMLYLNGIGKVDGPYPFFQVWTMPVWMSVLWFAVLFMLAFGLCQIPRLLARMQNESLTQH
jgi:hypothetical protein